jgi:hypothetical protein
MCCKLLIKLVKKILIGLKFHKHCIMKIIKNIIEIQNNAEKDGIAF